MARRGATHEVELIAYSVSEAAAAVGIDAERMAGLVRVGIVPHIALGTRRVIGKAALEDWLTKACWANATRPLGGQVTESRPEPLRPIRRRRAAGGSA